MQLQMKLFLLNLACSGLSVPKLRMAPQTFKNLKGYLPADCIIDSTNPWRKSGGIFCACAWVAVGPVLVGGVPDNRIK